ncbi:MAG TPA: cytochrome c [Terriglobales bacterium]|nr:cytochrome c [Terriglobales bacterium]
MMVVLLTGSVWLLTAGAMASDAPVVYKSKCVSCHAADGTGSPVGKKMGARDFHDPEVVKLTDQQLNDAITKGQKKMPAYSGKLTADQIKDLVAFIRDLQKKK